MRSRSSLLARASLPLGRADAPIALPREGKHEWGLWSRYLAVDGERIFQIGNICGTCEFLFRRVSDARTDVDVQAISGRLNEGLRGIDPEIVGSFSRLLSKDQYEVALFDTEPLRTAAGDRHDYFSNEARQDWIEDEDIEDPGTTYFRVPGHRDIRHDGEHGKLFEFLVPMQYPESLDAERISKYEAQLADGGTPTAVALTILDIKQFYDGPTPHWCLAHYLLDGHHKVAAAARSGRPVRLLSFIATSHGISGDEHICAALDLLETAAPSGD